MHTTPNILLLTVDTLRADMVGCYGGEPSTPNLDWLAASGVRFTQAITGGSWTQAAFPVLFTSTYASMYGGCLGPLSPLRPSPIESLATHGYRTAGFSTSPLLSRKYGYDRGFDEFHDLIPDQSGPVLRQIKGGQRLLRQSLTHYFASLVGRPMPPAPLYISAAQLTDHLCQWLGQSASPFFLWAHYMDIHWPYHREECLRRPNEIAQAWRDLAHMHAANWHGETITPQQRERYIRLYKEAVEYTDGQIGRLLAQLDDQGLLDETMIVVVSDHGEEFLERRFWGHFESNLYDEILKVPFILRLPNADEGQTVDRQVRLMDIMPTLLSLCNIPLPDAMEGTSFAPLFIENEGVYDADEAISEMWRPEWQIVAIRTEAYKYIWDSHAPHQPKLFDLKADPGERQNIAATHPKITDQFRDRLEAHLEKAQATAPAEAVDEMLLDAAVIERLRDLGYIQ